MKIRINSYGFAHPVLLILMLVGILGLIGFAGQRVMTNNAATKQEQEVDSKPISPILITSNGSSENKDNKSTNNKVTVNQVGSAAASSNQNSAGNASGETLPKSIQVETDYDISTPIGSLSQMILDAKAKRFSNVLYFITPRLMFRSYEVVSSQNLTDFAQQCQSNTACSSLLITDVSINPSHIIENECYDESYSVECKRIDATVALRDGKFATEYYKNVGYDNHKVSIYMLKYPESTNWVIDKVKVDNFTL